MIMSMNNEKYEGSSYRNFYRMEFTFLWKVLDLKNDYYILNEKQ